MSKEPAASHEHLTLSTTRARQGVELGRMRYVLLISLSVSLIALFVIFAYFFR